jgi:hypothetical protein
MNTIVDVKRNLKSRNNSSSDRRMYTDRQLLALRTGYSVSHISNMLNGSRNATFRFLESASKLAEHNQSR